MASFYGSPTTGNVPLTVSFTDVSSNSPTSWNWPFGDGIYSELQNPSHAYNRSGFKNVALTASDGTNYGTVIQSVTSKAPPLAMFTPLNQTIWMPPCVSFRDASAGSVTAWNWSFGDGTLSTVKNPTHCWGSGTYTVALNATDGGLYSTNSTTIRVY